MKFINRIYKEHKFIFWVLLILIFGLLYFGYDLLRYFPYSDHVGNLAEVQIIIEIISSFALILALLQFIEETKKPDLILWIEYLNGKGEWHLTQSNLEEYKSKQTALSARGVLGQPLTLANAFDFEFRLLIENRGKKIGRYVKITLELISNRLEVEASHYRIRLSRHNDPLIGKWYPAPRPAWDPEGNFHEFNGGEDFVAYSHPLEIQNTRLWLQICGIFNLRLPVFIKDQKVVDYKLKMTVQGEDFDIHEQVISVTIPQIIE